MTYPEFKQRISEIQYRLDHGCGDNSCKYHKPKGQATNGGCRCTPDFFKYLLWGIMEDLEPQDKYHWDKEEK